MRRLIHLRRLAAVVVVVPLLLASCADGGTGGEDAPSETSSSASAPSDDGSSGTSSALPSVDPATGPEISTDSVTLNVPEGWEVREVSSAITAASTPKGPLITISVKDFPVSTAGEVQSLAYVARSEVRAEAEATDPEILPETEIAGEPVFHLAGRITPDLWLESFGPAVADRSIVIGYEGLALVRENRRQEIIDSVLASVEWTY